MFGFTLKKPMMRHYQYAMALKRDSIRQHFSDQAILMCLDRMYYAKTKEERTRLGNEIQEMIEKDKQVHAELRKILD